MATRRQYAGAAVQTTITSSLSAVATTVDIASTTGWPSGATPYFVVISPGTTSEEKCLATRASATLTLTRGQDGTTGQSHSSGAVIYLVFTATDADESNEIAAAITTKGDLISRSSSAPARLAVGANGQFLQADSSTTTGLAWNYPPALKFRSGQYYSVPHRSQGSGSRTLNRTQFFPIYIPQPLTVDRIGISVVLGSSQTDTARLGIYNDTDGVPSTVLLDAGTVSVSGTNDTLAQVEITISQALGVGWYWLAANVQSSTGIGHSYYYPVDIKMAHLPTVRFVTAQGNNGYYEDSISGAFATAVTLVLTTSGGAGPGAWVRVA
jgi:hypothetical protein